MKAKITILLILLVCSAYSIQKQHNQQIPGDQGWDGLSLTWLPQFCHNSFCIESYQNQSRFIIHGYWPQSYLFVDCYQYDQKIQKYKNLSNYINQLQEQLNGFWPNSKDTDGFNIWQHEWDKHGTCYQFSHKNQNSRMSEKQIFIAYFNQTINKFNNLPVVNYTEPDQFLNQQSLAIALKLKPEYFYAVCEKNTNNYIKQIIVCYDRNKPGLQTLRECQMKTFNCIDGQTLKLRNNLNPKKKNNKNNKKNKKNKSFSQREFAN